MTWPQDTPHDPYSGQQPAGQEGYASPYSNQPASGAGGYANPYQQPAAPYGYQAAPARTNTLAILALVFAFVFSPAAIVLGHMAKKQIRQTGEDGEGLATAGLIIGYVFTAISLVACCGYVGIVATVIGQHSGTSY